MAHRLWTHFLSLVSEQQTSLKYAYVFPVSKDRLLMDHSLSVDPLFSIITIFILFYFFFLRNRRARKWKKQPEIYLPLGASSLHLRAHKIRRERSNKRPRRDWMGHSFYPDIQMLILRLCDRLGRFASNCTTVLFWGRSFDPVSCATL